MASRNELVRVALEELGPDAGAYEARMVKAIAAMLSAFKTSKKARTSDTKLAVSPQELFDAVRKQAGDKVLCEPIDTRWFGRLGGVLRMMPDFCPEDVERLVAWLNAGAMASWPQGVPTFSHLIRDLDRWLAFAREWSRRGRQEIRKGSAVGVSNPEASDFSAFKVPKLQ